MVINQKSYDIFCENQFIHFQDSAIFSKIDSAIRNYRNSIYPSEINLAIKNLKRLKEIDFIMIYKNRSSYNENFAYIKDFYYKKGYIIEFYDDEDEFSEYFSLAIYNKYEYEFVNRKEENITSSKNPEIESDIIIAKYIIFIFIIAITLGTICSIISTKGDNNNYEYKHHYNQSEECITYNYQCTQK